MKAGSSKYRLMMRALDDAGLTANIVRVGPGWYELHLNYEIIRKARKRETCNRHLARLTKTHLPPPIYNSSNQTIMFFEPLSGISPHLDFTMRVMSADNGTLTVSFTPASVDKMRPMLLTATPAEMDEKFFDLIRTPVELAAQLDTTEYEAELRQKVKEKRLQAEVKVEKDPEGKTETPKEQKPATPEKKSSGKSGGSKKAAPVKKEEPKQEAADETKAPESVIESPDSGIKAPESEISAPISETVASDSPSNNTNDVVSAGDKGAFTYNEHGVCENPEIVYDFTGTTLKKCEISVSSSDAGWHSGVEFKIGDLGTVAGCRKAFAFPTRTEAIGDIARSLIRNIEKAIAETSLKLSAPEKDAVNELRALVQVKYEPQDRVIITAGKQRSKVGTVLSGLEEGGKIVVDLDFGGGKTGVDVADLAMYKKHGEPEEEAEAEAKEVTDGLFTPPAPAAPARPAPPRPTPPRPAPATA